MNELKTQHSKLVKLMSFTQGMESPTPINLVEEMLSKLDEDLFKNPNTKFLDPCAGSGTFGVVLYNKLIEYHSHEWIMSEMIYLVDVSELRTHLLKKLGFKNIYKTDFLSEDFNMKFDVIVGNPPYQTGSKAKRWTLWSRFLEKVNTLTTDYVAFVIPNSWLGPNDEHNLVFSNLEYANLNISNYFKGVGSTFTYIITRCNSENNPLIETNMGVFEVPRDTKFLPNDARFISINNKFFKGESFNFSRTTEHHTSSKSKWESVDGEFEIFHSHASTLYSDVPPKRYSYESYKAIITLSGYSNFIVRNNIGTTQIGAWMEISEDEVESANSVLNSKLYQGILKVNKWSGWNSLNVIKVLPKMELTKVYSDQEIYDHFNLTQEEIDYVESYFK